MSRPETPPPASPDDDAAGIARAYRRVIFVWLAVLAGLWWLQHAFV